MQILYSEKNIERDELLLKNRSMQEINQFEMFLKKGQESFWAQIDGDSSGGLIFAQKYKSPMRLKFSFWARSNYGEPVEMSSSIIGVDLDSTYKPTYCWV